MHFGAIHSLNDILLNISSTTQLLITTHNPLFVSRNSIDANVIIRDNTAHISKNIKELRDELGVLASDNLINAELVILVEGESDVKIIKSLIKRYDKRLAKAVESGRMIIKSVNGVSKISQDIYYFKQMMCRILVIVDNDNAARKALEIAQNKNLLEANEYNVIRKDSKVDCEIEDYINVDIYKDKLEKRYGISLDNPKFRKNKKWSERLKNVFISQAKLYNEKIEIDSKIIVAESVVNNPNRALNEYHYSFFKNILENIINKLDS